MFKKLSAILTITLALTLLHSFALAEEPGPSVGLKVVDLVVIRPISAGVATVSTAFFIATSPLTFIFGVSEPAARVLVEAPWRFTGARYLGEFEHYKDGKPITVVLEK
jgi:hypothetical protein